METCVYEIRARSYLVCSVPHFRKLSQNVNIACNPVVPQQIYNKYIEKKSSSSRPQPASTTSRLTETKSKTHLNDDIQVDVHVEVDEEEILLDEVRENLLAGEYDATTTMHMLDNIDPDALSNLIDELTTAAASAAATTPTTTTTKKKITKKDGEEVEEEEEEEGEEGEEDEETLKRLVDNLMQSKRLLDDLKTDAKTFEANIDNLKRQT